jgi:hypothetical protein
MPMVKPAGRNSDSDDPAASAYPNFPLSWNLAPTDPPPVVRYDAKAGERSVDVMR